VPIIFFTAATQQVDEARASAAGANGFVTKPFKKNDLINFYGIKEEKIKTIYLGADQVFEEGILKSKEEIFIKYKVPVERPYFLSVSTIEPRKNFIQVLQSFKAYKLKNKDKDSILICTGMWGWKTSSLKKYLDSFDFRDDVFFTGYVDINDMPTLYHFAKSFIYLSLFEGFGLPILEAMKSKVPVICSNVSSMPEVIGEEGWLVDPLKTEEIVHAMEQISQNETLVKEKVNKAFERSKNFTWEKTVKETLEAYEI
jgi:glycosyltransferase involved in cell wall biosynthesis